jgi:hypothetical protein
MVVCVYALTPRDWSLKVFPEFYITHVSLPASRIIVTLHVYEREYNVSYIESQVPVLAGQSRTRALSFRP